ncbi:hypothetical protein [Rhodanobacter sp. MP1X3]|uniref:hypothetical protein n=1 Tax=Rhodanobacter sp. MP1X3 TaxID=2723086 RepID=UPI00160726A1|nr:hypothetical protein [Rhodanobacter sp. MP1X3]MBB6242111.1 hypothetical protein [Rhodanobacter sp. MP1X3]
MRQLLEGLLVLNQQRTAGDGGEGLFWLSDTETQASLLRRFSIVAHGAGSLRVADKSGWRMTRGSLNLRAAYHQ